MPLREGSRLGGSDPDGIRLPLLLFGVALVSVALTLVSVGGADRFLATTEPPPVGAPAVDTDPAVELYVRGLVTFNADLIWESMSPSLRADATERGRGLSTLRTDLLRSREQGRRYESVVRVGSVPLRPGGKVHFLVVTVRDRPDAAPREQAFVLTTDADDKITKIE